MRKGEGACVKGEKELREAAGKEKEKGEEEWRIAPRNSQEKETHVKSKSLF